MAQPRLRRRLRRFLWNILVMLGAFLALLVVLELVLSRTHWFGARRAYVRPDPFLRYRFEPNATYWFHEENDHPIVGRINAAGWRDRPRSVGAHPGIYRVAVLGDSYVEALQVEADSSFALLAEDTLNGRVGHAGSSYRFEVLNFGRSGFTQSEEWLVLLQDIPQYEPDLVVLFFYPGNDIRDIHPQTADTAHPFFSLNEDGDLILDVSFRETRSYKLRSWLNPLQRQSALVSLVVARMVTARRARHILAKARSDKESGTLPAYQSVAGSHPDQRYTDNYYLCKRLIARMVEFCKDRNTEFLLVCMPDAYHADDITALQNIDPGFDRQFFERDLRNLAASLQVHFLSLQEPFERAAAQGQDLRWVHWNYAGHRLVAEELSSQLGSIATAKP